jgi:murein DD-endopeptidase MepM/ murein hydrolase activator NlpD
MFIRMPAQGPLANSNARVALMFRSERGTRVVEIGGRTVTALILLAALLLAWYLFATLYLVLRDDFVVTYLSGQRRTHYAYEDRILELRSRIDKITARQLLNQETIEDRVSSLVARQAELEARQIMVSDLGARAESVGMPLPEGLTARNEPAEFTASSALPMLQKMPSKPQPLPPASNPQQKAMMTLTAPGGTQIARSGPMEGIVAEVERRSGAMEKAQVAFIDTLGASAEKEISRSRTAVATLGLDPGRFGKNAFEIAAPRPAPRFEGFMLRDVSSEGSAMGGPLLPPVTKPGTEAFDSAITRAEAAIDAATKARAAFKALPIGRPLGERYDLSSGFGSRLDPFTRSLAQHSGLDFRAPNGTAVHAVAPGTVIEAGYNGGYGRMVEIDHGFGITTRYAHLSSITLKEGDRVEKGAVLGHVGSTGRSTGPHLHYEVRIDDDARDPMRFVRAEKLLGLTSDN